MRTILATTLGQPSRRTLLTGAVAGCASTGGLNPAAALAGIEADLRTYIDFGVKNAGGNGDNAAGAWIQGRLHALGYVTARQPITAATIEEEGPNLRIGEVSAPVATHCLGAANRFASHHGPLSIWCPPHIPAPAPPGSIVVAHLPAQRWSSAEQPLVRDVIARTFEGGAAALVLVTHGPTGELVRLNRTLAPNRAHGPVALLSPRDWRMLEPGVAAVGGAATLTLNATASTRQAFNVTAAMDRGARNWLVISTPRSGWGVCGGERGPGVAASLALARWAPERFPHLDIALATLSSHEFENAGGEAYLEHAAPPTGETALWLHLGAGFAARDWHEAGARLLPLPSADPQRFLVATSESVEAARQAFRGLAGLEAAYDVSQGAGGELQNIIAAGYRAAGLFGAHRFHHVAQDDLRCVDPRLAIEALDALKRLLDARLG